MPAPAQVLVIQRLDGKIIFALLLRFPFPIQGLESRASSPMKHFPEIQLALAEARVLGSLLEKEVLTPDAYPLSLNSLVTACNQSSSRFPVTALAAEEVMEALRGLSEKYLVEKVLGGRTAKYEHCLQHVLNMQDSERAILTVLLLRGAQSAGELKQRTDRLHEFDSLDAVEETLGWFIDYPHGSLVKRIPVGSGRRVETFQHLLSEYVPSEEEEHAPLPEALSPADDAAWRATFEERLANLENELEELRQRLRL